MGCCWALGSRSGKMSIEYSDRNNDGKLYAAWNGIHQRNRTKTTRTSPSASPSSWWLKMSIFQLFLHIMPIVSDVRIHSHFSQFPHFHFAYVALLLVRQCRCRSMNVRRTFVSSSGSEKICESAIQLHATTQWATHTHTRKSFITSTRKPQPLLFLPLLCYLCTLLMPKPISSCPLSHDLLREMRSTQSACWMMDFMWARNRRHWIFLHEWISPEIPIYFFILSLPRYDFISTKLRNSFKNDNTAAAATTIIAAL